MFSEYASRFLAQSQSRLSLGSPEQERHRNPLERNHSRAPARSHLQRQPAGGSPYNPAASQGSRFPFASRLSQAPAPLFYSATDDFREEDVGEEHEKEVADYYALQRSRRDFGAPDEPERGTTPHRAASSHNFTSRWGRSVGSPATRGRGIHSSWTAEEMPDKSNSQSDVASENLAASANQGNRGKDRLVEVDLGSTIEEEEDEAAGRPTVDDEDDDDPPSLQQLHREPSAERLLRDSLYPQHHPSDSTNMSRLRQDPAESELNGPSSPSAPTAPTPNHDAFFASLFKISMIAYFASFVLVILHTSAPKSRSSLGDTVYSTLHSSFFLFATDTVVAIIVALVWLAMLRHYVRALVLLITAAVPVILVSFAIYPFASSFRQQGYEHGLQDTIIRWSAFVPAALSVFWVMTVYKGRHSLNRSIELLEFATRILEQMSALIMVGFATLGAVVAWTWIWMLMFTRVFLGGHKVQNMPLAFMVNTGTWWLAVCYVLVYLWVLAIISGVQRAVTAATVSQWYFHRYTTPAPTSQRVVQASTTHATTTIFGTICLSTLLGLAVRLPLLILPGRLTRWITLCFYSMLPTPVAILTNPLTLTYAAIHSQPLTLSARGLTELSFMSPTTATTTLTPRAFSKSDSTAPATPLIAYRLSKLILHATRWIASMSFGFGGWVATARMLSLDKVGYKGSVYAYVVGLIAGAIGYAVLGAMEGVLSGILDAVVVCWGSEVGAHGFGQARYCREAGVLLSEDARQASDV